MTDQESHRMEKNISVGDKYGPGMAITDPTEATAYFEKCVAHTMSWGKSREEAEDIERQNFGYYAGYYSDETRARVEKTLSVFASGVWRHPRARGSDLE